MMFFCKIKETQDGVRTLCDLKDGEKAMVRCIVKSQGCHLSKLAAMGLTPGTEIEMISNSSGPLMVLVRSSRLCLCRSLGKSVVVE
ncbi:MAG: ferrous iron transport protein A [Desulfomicrobium sp.]|nr:ferrous iron transport protein A [Pseudomonadota bacterium]MBV1711537.1 ferrous iron transport protein A [Desulfomicrobium sp.]MBU4572950.1 ferrous iron transport protein A [Pseudomonadota bacterium]MBU4594678.1 ferrous iron transport protein A [Pseudomonadota bacterium]MBV1718814.1 ferrous iron transport protein A [Desulfomicrobium sp.]